jgi:hypothetical protein
MVREQSVRGAPKRTIAVLVFFAAFGVAARAEKQEKKQISVKTPGGSFEATTEPDPSHLGLPIYPGAKLLKDSDESGGLDVNLAVSGEVPIRFVVAKFKSPDSVPKIAEFYKKRLGKEVTKFTEKSDDGSTVFELKHKSQQRYISLKSVEGGTEIDLVRVEGAEDSK